MQPSLHEKTYAKVILTLKKTNQSTKIEQQSVSLSHSQSAVKLRGNHVVCTLLGCLADSAVVGNGLAPPGGD